MARLPLDNRGTDMVRRLRLPPPGRLDMARLPLDNRGNLPNCLGDWGSSTYLGAYPRSPNDVDTGQAVGLLTELLAFVLTRSAEIIKGPIRELVLALMLLGMDSMWTEPKIYRADDHGDFLRIPDETTGSVEVAFGPQQRQNGSPPFVIEVGGAPVHLLITSELEQGSSERPTEIVMTCRGTASPVISPADGGNYVNYRSGKSAALSSLTFARKVGAISGPHRQPGAKFRFTDRDGVLASSPIPLIIEQAELQLTKSSFAPEDPCVVVQGPVVLSRSLFDLEANERDVAALVCAEGQRRPGPLRTNVFSGRAADIEIRPDQRLALVGGSSCAEMRLGSKSRVVLADGSSIQSIAGKSGSEVNVLLPEEGAAQKQVRVYEISGVAVKFQGSNDRLPGKAEMLVRGLANTVSFSNPMIGIHRGTVRFSEGAVGKDLKFDHDHHRGSHVTLHAETGSRLSRISGTMQVTALQGSVRGTEGHGFSICRFADLTSPSDLFKGGEITNLVVPPRSAPEHRHNPMGQQIVDAARGASGFTPHSKTWELQNRTFHFWSWVRSSYKSRKDKDSTTATNQSAPWLPLTAIVTRNNDWEDDLGFIDDLSGTVHEKSRDAAARCEAQIAVLNARQLSAVRRSERLLLLLGRMFGYGQRLGRPLLAAVAIAMLATVAMHLSDPLNLSPGNVTDFLRTFANILQSPVGILPGVNAPAQDDLPHWTIQLATSVPLAAFLLAIRNRTRWAKD